jgi:hypothetical protein
LRFAASLQSTTTIWPSTTSKKVISQTRLFQMLLSLGEATAPFLLSTTQLMAGVSALLGMFRANSKSARAQPALITKWSSQSQKSQFQLSSLSVSCQMDL